MKYYLFIIKPEYVKVYKNKSYVLYKLLEKLYNLKAYDFSYGLEIFENLCSPFSVKLLNNYMNDRIIHEKIGKIYKITSEKERTLVKINYSTVIIKTNYRKSSIFKIFNIYNRNIFMINFENKTYYWLNDYC